MDDAIAREDHEVLLEGLGESCGSQVGVLLGPDDGIEEFVWLIRPDQSNQLLELKKLRRSLQGIPNLLFRKALHNGNVQCKILHKIHVQLGDRFSLEIFLFPSWSRGRSPLEITKSSSVKHTDRSSASLRAMSSGSCFSWRPIFCS